MSSSSPTWLTVIAWIWLALAFASSGVILFDIFVRGHRQQMGVMDAVYPITAMYLGPVVLLLYWPWGRQAARPALQSGRTSSAAIMHQMAAVPAMAMAPLNAA